MMTIPVMEDQTALVVNPAATHVVSTFMCLDASYAAETLADLHEASPGTAAALVERARHGVETAGTGTSEGIAASMFEALPHLNRLAIMTQQAGVIRGPAAQVAMIRHDLTRAAALLIAALDCIDGAGT